MHVNFIFFPGFGSKTLSGEGGIASWVVLVPLVESLTANKSDAVWVIPYLDIRKQRWVRTVWVQPLRQEWRTEVGLKASASLNGFMSISKPRCEHLDLLLNWGKTAKQIKEVRRRRRKDTLHTCCVYSTAASLHKKIGIWQTKRVWTFLKSYGQRRRREAKVPAPVPDCRIRI